MALPNPIQVSGKHNAVYEAYYKQIDPKGQGAIEAMVAAKFLKKSGLSDVVLSRIWDLSDPNGKGYLDKAGFFVALKLVALAQAGQTIKMDNIFTDTQNPPKVGEIPKIMPQRIQSVPVTNTDWSIKVVDRLKYEDLFESLKPVNGLIAGNKVKGVLMDSKLPMDTLGRIWDLADQDKDGNLDKHEFTVAMHLVYQALDKRAVPAELPPELQKNRAGAPGRPVPPQPAAASIPRAPSGEGFGDGGFVANFPKDIAPPPIPPMPVAIPPISRVTPVQNISMPLISTEPLAPIQAAAAPSVDWVVTPADLKRFEAIFWDSDRDKDGLVSGLEVKNVFLQSGVPQNCLAHIWALCDTNQSGKLTLEQFALAMWMVERKRNGIEPPQALSPNMVPPTMRGLVPGVDVTPQVPEPPKPTYSNPELEMISKEIDELARERRLLETDIAQKEADIRIKTGEVRSLQSEHDTLAATLKQLENQKGEAQKRLDDLKAQKTEYDEVLINVNSEISLAREQVNKIRDQCHKQEETINEQESELNSKRSELAKLKEEEAALEKEYDTHRKELENLTRKCQDTQLQISQVRAMVTQLLEAQRQMTDALLLCKAAIESNDPNLVSDYSLKIEPDFYEAKKTLEKKLESPKKEDPFQEKDSGFGGQQDAFGTNGFQSDPFAASNARGGFDDSFNAGGGFDDAFSGSAFGSQAKDPFGGSVAADPFGEKRMNAVTPEPGKDDFGSDPFANLHAPTGTGQVLSPNAQRSGPPPRPESPSPALPPKKAKQPPPRPAPPRPVAAPSRPAQPEDAFGSSPGGGFADFADFDNKQPSIPAPQPPQVPSVFPSNGHLSSVTVRSTPTPTSLPSTTPVPIVAPTDFSDDPFKDYRYEDPFSIKDPFDEDDESSDAFFSDDSKKIESSELKTTSTTKAFDSPSGPDFFDSAFNSTSRFSPLPTAVTKSPRTTPIGAVDDNFANFDAFSTLQTTNTLNNNSNKIQQKTTTTNTSSTDFFDAFNDNFSSSATKSTSAFDAFGDIKAFNSATDNANKTKTIGAAFSDHKLTKSSDIKVFDDFNDNFEDDFFKMKLNESGNVTKKTNTTATDNFAKFDAFGVDDFASDFNNAKNFNLSNSKVQNKSGFGKTNNNDGDSGAKVPDKFADDYSKSDSFDDDLQEALKRSLAEN